MAMSMSLACLVSSFQAASRVNSSAARSSSAMSASLKDTPWNLPIGWPNCTRCAAHCLASSRAPSARPAQVGERQDAVGIPAVRDVAIPGQHLEAGGADVDQKRGDQLALTAAAALL